MPIQDLLRRSVEARLALYQELCAASCPGSPVVRWEDELRAFVDLAIRYGRSGALRIAADLLRDASEQAAIREAYERQLMDQAFGRVKGTTLETPGGTPSADGASSDSTASVPPSDGEE